MYLKEHIKVPKTEVHLFLKMKNDLCTRDFFESLAIHWGDRTASQTVINLNKLY